MKRKLKKWIALCLAAVFCLTGCAEHTQEDAAENKDINASTEPAGTIEGSDKPGAEEGLDRGGMKITVGEEKWFVKETVPVQTDSVFYDTYENKLYLLSLYDGQDGPVYGMQVFDADKKELSEEPFSLQVSGKEEFYVVSMDVLPDKTLSFRMADGENGKQFLVKTDLQGNVLAQEESFPAEDAYPWNPDLFSGSSIRTYDNADGSTVIAKRDTASNSVDFFWYDRSTGDRRKFGTLDGQFLNGFFMAEDGLIYCVLDGDLLKWDAKNDSCVKLFSLYEYGISGFCLTNNLLKNADGEIVILDTEGKDSGIYVFSSRAEDRPKVDIRFVGTGYDMSYASRMANMFSNSGRNCNIEVTEADEDDRDAIRNRLFAELAAGEGPELMWLDAEELRTLGEKGLLADLAELIPEATRKQIFPGVLQMGNVDGRMVGLAPSVYMTTVLTSNEVWQEERWSVSDFLKLMEERENVACPAIFNGGAIGYYNLLYLFFVKDWSRCPFVDWERRTCSFDSEEFIRVLETCKKYGDKGGGMIEKEERARMLVEGETLATVWYDYGGYMDFWDMRRQYGDTVRTVGYPTDTESGNYLVSFGYLAVNAKAEHRPEIREFIAYLLDFDNQMNVWSASVRRDVTIRQLDEAFASNVANPGFWGDHYQTETERQTAWEAFSEEYLAFMENASAEPNEYNLGPILGEELQNYFEGDKSAQETARVIQNRVQLYLNELP